MGDREAIKKRIRIILEHDRFKWFYLSQFISAEIDDLKTIQYQIDHEIPEVISIIKEDEAITDKEKMLSILDSAIEIRKEDIKRLEEDE